jgi:hypothetical protein
VVAQLGDAEPDVLARPVTATSMALDTIVSRRTSTNGRPGTPDSDGFGYSEVSSVLRAPAAHLKPFIVQRSETVQSAAHSSISGVKD